MGDLVDKKNARRYDDCLSYTMVASKKASVSVVAATNVVAAHGSIMSCVPCRVWLPVLHHGGLQKGKGALLCDGFGCLSDVIWQSPLPADTPAPPPPLHTSVLKALQWTGLEKGAPPHPPPPQSTPTYISVLQALQWAGLEKHANPEGHEKLDKTRVGVLVGSGMGGLQGAICCGSAGAVEWGPCWWAAAWAAAVVQLLRCVERFRSGWVATCLLPCFSLEHCQVRLPALWSTHPRSCHPVPCIYLPATKGDRQLRSAATPPHLSMCRLPPYPPYLPAVFQDGVKALVEKGYKKITPFFIPYAITNMGAPSLRACAFFLEGATLLSFSQLVCRGPSSSPAPRVCTWGSVLSFCLCLSAALLDCLSSHP